MNAPHEEAVEFAKISKRENRVYVGNLSYDVRYRDLMEFMRGGGFRFSFGLGREGCVGGRRLRPTRGRSYRATSYLNTIGAGDARRRSWSGDGDGRFFNSFIRSMARLR